MALTRATSSVTGMRELLRRLDAVADPRTRREGVKRLTARALTAVKEETPVKTGNLRRRNRILRMTEDGATIGNDALYAKAVHGGARAHVIVPSRRKALRFKGGDGRYVFRRSVNHPGNRANPFMRRGLQRAAREGGREVLDAVIDAWNGAA